MLKTLFEFFIGYKKFKHDTQKLRRAKRKIKAKINTHRRRFTDIKPQASQEDI